MALLGGSRSRQLVTQEYALEHCPIALLCMLSRMRETASTVGQWFVPCQMYLNKILIGQ